MFESKKQPLEYEDNDGFVEGYGNIHRVTYACPTCGFKVIFMEDRCCKCEQKLDWR